MHLAPRLPLQLHFVGIDGVNYNADLIAIGVSHAPYQDGLELVVDRQEELLCWISSGAFQ
jgi:hypothetical protein